ADLATCVCLAGGEKSHIEYSLRRFGFSVLHYGRRGTTVALFHIGFWGDTLEIFFNGYYRYLSQPQFDQLRGVDPLCCIFDLPVISHEFGNFRLLRPELGENELSDQYFLSLPTR